MNKGKGVELNFLPISGKALSVALKEVTDDNRTELTLNGKSEGDLALGSAKVLTTLRQTLKNLNRITLHLRRKWENDSLPMIAACRMQDRDRQTGEIKDGKPFGFSLETSDKYPNGQFFLNLVYLSPEKPEGFEPLYLKMKQKDKDNRWQTDYLKISVARSDNTLTIITEKVSEADAPASLTQISFDKPTHKADTALLQAFVGSKSK